jgi:uncharacterized protein
MVGTIINALGALLGGILGFVLKRQPDTAVQTAVKSLIGILLVWVGLAMTWVNLGGGIWSVCKQMTIVVLALTFGRITGRLLHLQKMMNRLGQFAREQFAKVEPGKRGRFGDGFVTCAILYCVTPLSFLGAIFDGLSGSWYALGVKAVLDGFAGFSFSRVFGWASLLAVLPLVVAQGTIALAAQPLGDWLRHHGLLESVGATGGLLIFCVAMLVLELRKVEVSDYLPALAFAPLITWFLK